MTGALSQLYFPGNPLEWLVVLGSTLTTVAVLRGYASPIITLTVAVVGLLGCLVMGHASIPLAFAIVSVILRYRGVPMGTENPRPFLAQTGLILSGLAVYEILRKAIIAPREVAEANARKVLHIEEPFSFISEAKVQKAVVHGELSMHFFNGVYTFFFLAVVAGLLYWLFFEHDSNFRLYRDCLAISAGLAIVTILLFPVAPPRFIPEAGVVDTFIEVGKVQEFANEYAAVPSLHVGWSALTGFVMGRTLGGRLGLVIGVIPGSLMMLTVLATGNHYWVDGLIGTSFTMIPALILLRLRQEQPRRATFRTPARASS